MADPLKIKKAINKFQRFFTDYWVDELNGVYIPMIQDMIMESYDSELVGVVTNRDSKTNPLFYREEFLTALYNFEYIKEEINSITLSVPDEDNFPWLRGRLRIIKNILDGTVGTFVEVDEEQYIKMFGKRPISENPYDNTVQKKERIYLLRYNSDVQRRERNALGRTGALVRYPFSNIPPIDIFGPTANYVENNLNNWINETIKKAQKEFRL